MIDPVDVLIFATHSWSKENGWLVTIPGSMARSLELTDMDVRSYVLPAWKLENRLDRFRV